MKSKKVVEITIDYMKNKKIFIVFLFVLKTLSVGLGILVPYMLGNLIDKIEAINFFSILRLIILSLISLSVESFITYQFSLLGQNSAIQVRKKLWDKILSLKVPSYDKTHSGELSSRIINDTSSMATFLTNSIPDIYASVLTLLLMIIILFSLDAWLGATFCLVFPLIIIVMIPVANKIKDVAIVQQEIYAKLNQMFTESIEQIRFVKAYNAEKYEKSKISKKMDDWFSNTKRYSLIQAILSPVMGGVTSMALFAICGIGAYRVHMGYITTGTIIIFALYLVNAIEPVEAIGNFFMEYREVEGSLLKVNEIFALESENFEGIVIDSDNNYKLSMESVQFGYNNELVIKNISFCANKDERIAIVGESGVGKTTLFSLIERFYDNSSGSIEWQNHSIDKISLREWRNKIGYVFQDKMILSGTIRENMLYGIERMVEDKELIEAAQKANIYDYIRKQDLGFDTYVGEKGELLSGGEKQRIAIARMFLKDPKLLLLDEITANLDAESEQQVSKSLENLYKGRITLIIAHKLQTVKDATKILILKNGYIVGSGSHDQLLKENEYYQNVIKYELRE